MDLTQSGVHDNRFIKTRLFIMNNFIVFEVDCLKTGRNFVLIYFMALIATLVIVGVY